MGTAPACCAKLRAMSVQKCVWSPGKKHGSLVDFLPQKKQSLGCIKTCAMEMDLNTRDEFTHVAF